tara:strand:- start:68 stop:1582 length:1515 start_codon:yes stop_codon:yes gene_type:complete
MSKKLLRLHTTDFNSIFDCVFNEELKINPYSEIALHSASFPVANRFINIDATNDTLTYQVQNTGPNNVHTINIQHGTYSKHNASNLLESITNAMNQDLDINLTKEHGTEISVNLNTDTRISFEFGFSKQLVISSSAQDQTCFFDNARTSVASRKNSIKLVSTGDQSQDNDKGYIIGEVPFTRGCGNIVFDLSTYQTGDGNAGDNAITFGLIPQSLFDIYKDVFPGDAVPADVSIDKWKYAVPLSKLGGPTGLTQGSQISMDLSKGKISFREYKQDNSIRLLAEVEYDTTNLDTELLYPAVILHHEPQYLIIKNLKYSPSPFNLPPTVANEATIEETVVGVAPKSVGRATVYNLTFPAISVRDYFGFSESNLNPLARAGIDLAGSRAFQGQTHFTNMTSSDNYLIEMLNIKLDSYDSFTPNNVGGGRKNILAPIPVSEQIIDNQTGLVQYEPNNFNFISINNEYALNLRNIRMRIIDFQHSPILNNGFQSVNIIIRDTDKTKEAM